MNLIFIVGTARSGTSAVAQLIERMGAMTLPKTVIGNYNPDYQENFVLNALCYGIHPWHKLQPKELTDTNIKAIASYILEHALQLRKPGGDVPLVLKCPAFPFMIPELKQVIMTIHAMTGEDVHATFIRTDREREAQIKSLQNFTMHTWPDEHWEEVLDAGLFHASKMLAPDSIIFYECLLGDWKGTAQWIAERITGLTVPEDGGIDTSLNHSEAVYG